MAEKETISPTTRKLISFILLLGVSGTFMAFYYLVYLPGQQASFNQRMFRVLHEMANNFATRAENYGQLAVNSYVNTKKEYIDDTVFIKKNSPAKLKVLVDNSFKGNVDATSKIIYRPHFNHDSIEFKISDAKNVVLSTKKSLSEILEPLISIHASTFESILLLKLAPDGGNSDSGNAKKHDVILYKSSQLDIASINTDSLLANKKFKAATLSEIVIEGVTYKIFLMPFQMALAPDETFVLSGIISNSNYNQRSQDIPVDFFITIVFILVFILLCLPFLKVFILSARENIVLADIRFMISSIFIIPLAIVLCCSLAWIHIYPDRFTDGVLNSLQNEIDSNFCKEIRLTISQEKEYDAILSNPSKNLKRFPDTTINNVRIDSIAGIEKKDMKDFIFYPSIYKNTENIHWMNKEGKDIAVWRFTKDPATYLNLASRQYFTDILYKKGYHFPNSNDTFTLQPTLSKLTGEYTLNIATPSQVKISGVKESLVTGISSRMYSVFNTVVPPGYGYFLIDKNGEMIFSSDTARSLQENLFEETDQNHALKNAVDHKQSTPIDDVHLYDESVKMLVKPLDVLPYYLVTYYNKRSEYLFLIHILAFVFLSTSLILMFASLFSYCLMMLRKKMTKLLFVPGILNWLKPSTENKQSYIRNWILQISLIGFFYLFSIGLSPEQDQLYLLNCALLLPLMSVTGNYIIKRAKNILDGSEEKKDEKLLLLWGKHKSFLFQIIDVILLYGLSVLIFTLIQDNFIYKNHVSDGSAVNIRIMSLIIVLPVAMFFIGQINIAAIIKRINRSRGDKVGTKKVAQIYYLRAFIISLMLSVLTISVVPAILLTRYALNEERNLHFQSYQLSLAKKIQDRRTALNPRFWQTKLSIFNDIARSYIDSLKFTPEKGLYLGGLQIDTESFCENPVFGNQKDNSSGTCRYRGSYLISYSPFYREITQFLFLPPDHDEFYDNLSDHKFYYWEKSTSDSIISLHYKSLADHKNPKSIVLSGALPVYDFFEGNTFTSYLLMLAIIVLVILLFYKVISSVAKRIFLIDYFEDDEKQKEPLEDREWLKQSYYLANWVELRDHPCFTGGPESFTKVRKIENRFLRDGKDECILQIHLSLLPAYEYIWKECTDEEKFVMYDFALDGFTNHKKAVTLFQLYNKGLMIKEDDNLHLVTRSFRNFILTKDSSEVIKNLSVQSKGSWSTLRTVFYVVILVVAAFIFLSQEEASKRLITIVTSLGALLPALIKLFDKSTVPSGANKSSS